MARADVCSIRPSGVLWLAAVSDRTAEGVSSAFGPPGSAGGSVLSFGQVGVGWGAGGSGPVLNLARFRRRKYLFPQDIPNANAREDSAWRHRSCRSGFPVHDPRLGRHPASSAAGCS